jgi:hypothetical protein
MEIPGSLPGSMSVAHGEMPQQDPLFNMSGSFPDSGFPTHYSGHRGLYSHELKSMNIDILDSVDSTAAELQRTKDELISHRAKLIAWEDGLKQARQACEAWKREAETNKVRALQLDMERKRMKEERDAVSEVQHLEINNALGAGSIGTNTRATNGRTAASAFTST